MIVKVMKLFIFNIFLLKSIDGIITLLTFIPTKFPSFFSCFFAVFHHFTSTSVTVPAFTFKLMWACDFKKR